MTDPDLRERIAQAIEARADAIQASVGPRSTFDDHLKTELRAEMLRYAARIARETPLDDGPGEAANREAAADQGFVAWP